ncbi:cytochrome P450 [Plectonema radiosum NIES-515]|uniref:Cytochrome P450 n=1 Tax=Plectonema radiosum NIES-515 TaxID=2986073 RepID=A0ABT3B5N2_9CYAN|nr:cytochrome P450 [Plectonema radiosum]MCV3216255.1 cytochrome P450 [Plectonema radiosum NIES-515]
MTSNEYFAVSPSMQEISLRVILQAVFSMHQGEHYEQLKQLLCSVLDTSGSPLGGNLLRKRQQMNNLL